MLNIVKGIWLVFVHAFQRRVTVQYPEEQPYFPPRWRGRIILSRDPDGQGSDASVATFAPWPAPWTALRSKRRKIHPDGGILSGSASISPVAFSVATAKKPARPMPFSSPPTSR